MHEATQYSGQRELPMQPAMLPTMRRGMRKQCPCCGARNMFDGFLRMRRHCPDCSWIFEREPGSGTGAMYVSAVITQTFSALLFLLVWFGTEWELITKLTTGIAVNIGFALWFFPLSKSLWAAVDYLTDFHSGDAYEPDYESRAFARAVAPLSETWTKTRLANPRQDEQS